ncbi:MAG: tyrosine-type recombinase/integrase, partial [Nitrospinales bacterium]
IETTKNSDPVRIPICGKLMEVLKGLNRVRNLHDDKIFHVTGRAFQKAWKRAREKAGFPWARVHDIRHSFASSLVNASVSIEVIGKLLNHRDLRSTRIYSHLADKTLKEAVSAFDKEPEPPRNVCKLPAKQEGTFKNKR